MWWSNLQSVSCNNSSYNAIRFLLLMQMTNLSQLAHIHALTHYHTHRTPTHWHTRMYPASLILHCTTTHLHAQNRSHGHTDIYTHPWDLNQYNTSKNLVVSEKKFEYLRYRVNEFQFFPFYPLLPSSFFTGCWKEENVSWHVLNVLLDWATTFRLCDPVPSVRYYSEVGVCCSRSAISCVWSFHCRHQYI